MRLWMMFLLLPVAAVAQEGKSFTLKGRVQLQQPVDWVYISYRQGDDLVRDSFQLQGDKFTYKGRLAEPTLASLRIVHQKEPGAEKPKWGVMQVFLEKGKTGLKVKDSINNYKVTSSKAHADYAKLLEAQKPYGEIFGQLQQSYVQYRKAQDRTAMNRIEAQSDSVDQVLKEKVFKTFVQANPQSPVALYAVKQYAGYDIDAQKVEPLFALLPAATRALPSAVAFAEQLEIAKKTGIGQLAMDFTQTDTAGVPVSLSQFRGQFVLLDFWASWCGPCRVENPNVVKVFNKYKDKGFTVLGVSLDREGARDKWLKAIHDDKLTWTHVSDLKFWNNAVAQQYGIRAIPVNLLIDPQGKIVARNVRGEALEEAVEKAMKAKAF